MRASRSDYAGNWVNSRQKKFRRGKFRYSARTRVVIEEKSVRIVQRMENPAARTIHRLALTANHNSLRSRLPEGPRPASGSLDADTPRLCRCAASIAGGWKIQPLEKQLVASSYQLLAKPKVNANHDGPTTAGLQPTTAGLQHEGKTSARLTEKTFKPQRTQMVQRKLRVVSQSRPPLRSCSKHSWNSWIPRRAFRINKNVSRNVSGNLCAD